MRRGPVVTLLVLGAAMAVVIGANHLTTEPQSAKSPTTAATPTNVPTPRKAAPPKKVAAKKASVKKAAPDFPDKAVYVGRTAGGEAAIAIAVLRDRAAAYFCDGHSTEAWLAGTARQGRVWVKGPDGSRLEGVLDGRWVNGRAWIGSRSLRFRIDTASRPAGLYRGEAEVDGRPSVIGWIVLEDGSQVGLKTDERQVSPAPRLELEQGRGMAGDVPIVAEPVNGPTDLSAVTR